METTPGNLDARGPAADGLTPEELQLALRNHGMPLEALRYPRTPVGLHYLLTHYDIPLVDPDHWRLRVAGRVSNELELSLPELRSLPTATVTATMECAGNGRAALIPRPVSQPWLGEAVGTAAWRGTPLCSVLDLAGVSDDAIEVVCTGLDRGVEGGVEQAYARSLSVADARRAEVLLAYDMNDWPLLPQHGFPLRLLVPGWYGMTNVKWVSRIEVVAEPFDGYQQARSYRLRTSEEEAGTPVTRMLPRALMVPPGIPEFLTRQRFVDPGSHRVEGRAWSGYGAVTQVEMSTDGGVTWRDAQLGEQASPFAWRSWWFTWEARIAGDHVLCCRATDAHGHVQPLEPTWNLGGYENNAVQRVLVTVGERAV